MTFLGVGMDIFWKRIISNSKDTALTGPSRYCNFAVRSCLFGGCGWFGSLPSASILKAPLGMGYDVGIHSLPCVVQRMLGAMKSNFQISIGMAVIES